MPWTVAGIVEWYPLAVASGTTAVMEAVAARRRACAVPLDREQRRDLDVAILGTFGRLHMIDEVAKRCGLHGAGRWKIEADRRTRRQGAAFARARVRRVLNDVLSPVTSSPGSPAWYDWTHLHFGWPNHPSRVERTPGPGYNRLTGPLAHGQGPVGDTSLDRRIGRARRFETELDARSERYSLASIGRLDDQVKSEVEREVAEGIR